MGGDRGVIRVLVGSGDVCRAIAFRSLFVLYPKEVYTIHKGKCFLGQQDSF